MTNRIFIITVIILLTACGDPKSLAIPPEYEQQLPFRSVQWTLTWLDSNHDTQGVSRCFWRRDRKSRDDYYPYFTDQRFPIKIRSTVHLDSQWFEWEDSGEECNLYQVDFNKGAIWPYAFFIMAEKYPNGAEIVGNELIDSYTCTHYRAITLDPKQRKEVEVNVWIDTSKFIRKVIQKLGVGKDMYMQFYPISYNANIPDSLFEIPSKLKIIDNSHDDKIKIRG